MTAAAALRDERQFTIAWQNTLAIVAQLYNVNRPARARPIAIDRFNPYRETAAPPPPPTAAQEAILESMFPATKG